VLNRILYQRPMVCQLTCAGQRHRLCGSELGMTKLRGKEGIDRMVARRAYLTRADLSASSDLITSCFTYLKDALYRSFGASDTECDLPELRTPVTLTRAGE
jgi:hypothetical protein